MTSAKVHTEAQRWGSFQSSRGNYIRTSRHGCASAVFATDPRIMYVGGTAPWAARRRGSKMHHNLLVDMSLGCAPVLSSTEVQITSAADLAHSAARQREALVLLQ
mmetsp:Transcript_141955/g.395656  ORF Transcript_141955/g.395656 Transcript_141955/m.395656 type:complete len:105 (+) Transcript_141955:560-874(+)